MKPQVSSARVQQTGNLCTIHAHKLPSKVTRALLSRVIYLLYRYFITILIYSLIYLLRTSVKFICVLSSPVAMNSLSRKWLYFPWEKLDVNVAEDEWGNSAHKHFHSIYKKNTNGSINANNSFKHVYWTRSYPLTINLIHLILNTHV